MAFCGLTGQAWWQAPQPMHIELVNTGSGSLDFPGTIRTAPVGQCSALSPIFDYYAEIANQGGVSDFRPLLFLGAQFD